jgi:hypothetical protein
VPIVRVFVIAEHETRRSLTPALPSADLIGTPDSSDTRTADKISREEAMIGGVTLPAETTPPIRPAFTVLLSADAGRRLQQNVAGIRPQRAGLPPNRSSASDGRRRIERDAEVDSAGCRWPRRRQKAVRPGIHKPGDGVDFIGFAKGLPVPGEHPE